VADLQILLTTLNAKFIHSSLSLRYLQSYCRRDFPKMIVEEFDINQPTGLILGEIFRCQPNVVAFSCYIWNINQTLVLARLLKQVLPALTIILGGPEVTYDAPEVLQEHPYLDFIVVGEGEQTFCELLKYLREAASCQTPLNSNLTNIPSLVYRQETEIVQNPRRQLPTRLDVYPSPYAQGAADLGPKLAYYETSRGCPFRCQYCLSAAAPGVRYFSMERVQSDLRTLIAAGTPLIKFVDRTFNSNQEHALTIFDFILNNPGRSRFHFEIVADLLTDKMLDYLARVPPGLFQFEIGIQSTHRETLSLIQRRIPQETMMPKIKMLQAAGRVLLHLDLIAGLPGEDYQRFQQSFNDVFALRPGRIQLGFLKLLKGSGLREKAETFGYIYSATPPYEVLGNHWISYAKLRQLKDIESVLDTFYNTHRFDQTINYLLARHYPTPFDFWHDLARYWIARRYHRAAHQMRNLYQYLATFCAEKGFADLEIILEFLKFDYFSFEKSADPPAWCRVVNLPGSMRKKSSLVTEHHLVHYLPQLAGLTPREIYRRVRVEAFACDVTAGVTTVSNTPTLVVFDYGARDPLYRRAQVTRVPLDSP
jgi:radical SAM superfamily enzyme YgiQ (UPF0313 family)